MIQCLERGDPITHISFTELSVFRSNLPFWNDIFGSCHTKSIWKEILIRKIKNKNESQSLNYNFFFVSLPNRWNYPLVYLDDTA